MQGMGIRVALILRYIEDPYFFIKWENGLKLVMQMGIRFFGSLEVLTLKKLGIEPKLGFDC